MYRYRKAAGLIFLACIFILAGCADTSPLRVKYSDSTIPPAPDYSNPFYWSALPDREDAADHIPSKSPVKLIDNQKNATADVFYIHPTTYFGKNNWNADLSDKKINASTDSRAVFNQASVFNGSCKIYAPRYRQVSYHAYFTLTDSDAIKAFALAYSDIKNAFQYYLDNYNNGRPIIIAGHSQGTTMAKWLLRDFFDGKPLQKKLIAAYLPGMPVYKNEFVNIPPGDSAKQTGCFISWRSYLEGNDPKPKYAAQNSKNIVVTNPVTFTGMPCPANCKEQASGLGRDGNTIYENVCSVQIHNDIVWVSRPDIPGKKFIPKNLHPADYNLYWINIRNNVADRVAAYEKLNAGGN